ncbi:MAG TPA: peptide chain release factor N(5)-glutamine methyltransferase [Candidatus Dormibacteraeota bacterium]|nr:peptide chain release factor N(5)-glutamine methyltransferase [Candidatus Dormibacteraeota bacterium]
MNVRTALKEGIARLREAGASSYIRSAELLLLHSLGCNRAWLYAHPEESISDAHAGQFLALIGRRASGEPTQHLTGKQEFWGLEFEVSPDVLIPRPETEHVIEVALDRLALRELRAGRPQKNSGDGLLIADIGTGSGCIAVAFAKELPDAIIYATDNSLAALAVARRNGKRHNCTRIHFIESNLLDQVQGPVAEQKHAALLRAGKKPLAHSRSLDLIVSNPPYIGRREAETLEREVREHEPESALYGGEEGYEIYAGLIAQAATRLRLGGILVLELGHNSLPAVRPLLDAANWSNVGVTNDLAGIPRIIAAEKL